jgi:ketosteroid isomerase-like protein
MSETTAIEFAIRAAETRIMTAIRERDVAALERELAEDFLHTALGGNEQDRAAFLRTVAEMPFRILSLEGENLRFRRLGEAALLTGLQRGRVQLPEGGVVVSLGGFVDVFTHANGHWRLSQAVSVELPAPPEA